MTTIFRGSPSSLNGRDGEPVALAEIADGELRPFRVFNFKDPMTDDYA